MLVSSSLKMHADFLAFQLVSIKKNYFLLASIKSFTCGL